MCPGADTATIGGQEYIMTTHPETVTATATIGAQYLRALTTDADAFEALFADEVDFQALTPNRVWVATCPGDVREIIVDTWLRPDYRPMIRSTRMGGIGARDYLSYRVDVDRGDGPE